MRVEKAFNYEKCMYHENVYTKGGKPVQVVGLCDNKKFPVVCVVDVDDEDKAYAALYTVDGVNYMSEYTDSSEYDLVVYDYSQPDCVVFDGFVFKVLTNQEVAQVQGVFDIYILDIDSGTEALVEEFLSMSEIDKLSEKYLLGIEVGRIKEAGV